MVREDWDGWAGAARERVRNAVTHAASGRQRARAADARVPRCGVLENPSVNPAGDIFRVVTAARCAKKRGIEGIIGRAGVDVNLANVNATKKLGTATAKEGPDTKGIVIRQLIHDRVDTARLGRATVPSLPRSRLVCAHANP